jgi:sulfopropanediol 3-dehydrogenase
MRLGHRNIPVQSVGSYVPGGKIPTGASARMSVATASIAGAPRMIAATPPFNGDPCQVAITATHLGGTREIHAIGDIQTISGKAIAGETAGDGELCAIRALYREEAA